MIRIYILILLYSSCGGTTNAQIAQHKDSFAVTINIVGNYGDFLIDVIRSDHSLNVKFQLKDSVDEQKWAKDPKYRRVMRLMKEGRMVYNKANSEAYMAGYKKYTVYFSDSLVVQKDSVSQLDNLLSRIVGTKNDELVDKSVSYLDGFDIQLVINAFGTTRSLNANSPSQKYSPLIKELLHHLVVLSKTTKTHLLQRTVIRGY